MNANRSSFICGHQKGNALSQGSSVKARASRWFQALRLFSAIVVALTDFLRFLSFAFPDNRRIALADWLVGMVEGTVSASATSVGVEGGWWVVRVVAGQ